ncbi:MAG: hypothetical protein M3O90_07435, partial [Actinomycetota bacterium]|nr:hypothetical protein [Actinomycetota bacterium]
MAAFVIALVMLPLSVSVAVSDHRHDRAAERRTLTHKAGQQATALEEYFARARSITLLTAHNPAFADFYA